MLELRNYVTKLRPEVHKELYPRFDVVVWNTAIHDDFAKKITAQIRHQRGE